MDINNDKEIINEEQETADVSVETDVEVTDTAVDEMNEISGCDDILSDGTEDTEAFYEDAFEEFDDSEEIAEEISEEVEEESSSQKKTFPIQKSVFIAIIAFVLTAVIAFGSFFVYDIIEKNKEKLTVVGVWAPAEDVDSGYYYIFEDDGAFSVNIGGQVLSGTYTTEDYSSENASGESEEYQVITITPCVFSDYESQAKIILSEDKNTLSLEFSYTGSVNLVRTELPEYKLDGSKITHASADEVGLDSFYADDEIIGSWSMSDYTGVEEIYTLYADGTGEATDKFVDGGYSITTYFKYTTKDGKIYLSIELFNGSTSDGELEYYMDNGKLILNNLAYEAVK